MMRSVNEQTLLYFYSPALDATALAGYVVFVVFGIWSLHQRFRRLEEWSLRTQLLTLSGLLFFYVVETTVLRRALHDNIVFFIFALLGLFVAGLALYGHIVVSVLSRLLVELVAPDNPAAPDIPRLGPAEALERQGDWNGALQEYYILARIYPDQTLLYTRIANNLIRLERKDDASSWLKRAIKHSKRPDECLALSRRLFDIYKGLGRPELARQALTAFLKRFPEHAASDHIRKQLSEGPSGADSDQTSEVANALESLAKGDLTDVAASETSESNGKTLLSRQVGALTTLEAAPLVPGPDKEEFDATESQPSKKAQFDAIDTTPLSDTALDAAAKRKRPHALDPMEDAPTTSMDS